MIKKDMNLVYKTPAVKAFSVGVRRCMAFSNEDYAIKEAYSVSNSDVNGSEDW